jgi:hypothetical protein
MGSEDLDLGPWREVPAGLVPGAGEPGQRFFQRSSGDGGLLTVLLGQAAGGGWRLGIAHTHPPRKPRQRRFPSWLEVDDVRSRFLPAGARMAMIMPPPGEPNTTFSLWEVPGDLP